MHLIFSGIVQEAVDFLVRYSSFCSFFLHLCRTVPLFPLITSAVAEFVIANLGKQFIDNLQARFGPLHKDKSSSAALVLVLSTGPDSIEAFSNFTKSRDVMFRKVSITLFDCTCCQAAFYRCQYQISKYFSDI